MANSVDEEPEACLVQSAVAAPERPEDACFALNRQLWANPTYVLGTSMRVSLVGEILEKPSGMVEHQWHMPDLVKESVYALEQRLLQGANVFQNERSTTAVAEESVPQHDAKTELLDEQGLLRLFPIAVKAFLERPWRFYPHGGPGYAKTVCTVPSKRDTNQEADDSLFCLEIWVCRAPATPETWIGRISHL